MAEQPNQTVVTFKKAITKIFKDTDSQGRREIDKLINNTTAIQKKELKELKRAFDKDNELFNKLGFIATLSNIRSSDLLRDIIAFMVMEQ